MIDVAIEYVRAAGLAPPYSYGIVIETGLDTIAELVTDGIEIPYENIPGYLDGSVSTNAGKLVAGTLHGAKVIFLAGRAQYHETGTAAAMRLPIELLAALGVRNLLLTACVSSLNREIAIGQLCIVKDHINLTGINPLVGEMGDNRFVAMDAAYSVKLRSRLKKSATDASMRVAEGVLMWFTGPSAPTSAEVRVARTMGADLATMCIIPETILGRFCGMDVAAVTFVTHHGAGMDADRHVQQDLKLGATDSVMPLRRLITQFFKGLLNG